MRIEYKLELDKIDMPYFSIDSSEGIHKLFTLSATLLNLLEAKESVCVTIHGGSAQDPERKAKALEQIIESGRQEDRRYGFERVRSGSIENTHYLWVTIRRL
ncbi:MAG: hypothetical protein Q8R92_05480 [Deltaproteobacteria bacterium]|nr:hypothetical protein [Deltaproteobacteria bacterium]